MADIELIVKIPEDDYEKIKWTSVKNGAKEELDYMRGLILSGKPLPKGHGRLIDADALPLNDIDDANYGSNYIRIAPTIIEGSDSE